MMKINTRQVKWRTWDPLLSSMVPLYLFTYYWVLYRDRKALFEFRLPSGPFLQFLFDLVEVELVLA